MTAPAFNNSSDLLRRLGPTVLPRGLTAGAANRAASPTLFESRSFDDLLSSAFAGHVHSDRPVQVACDLQPPVATEQLERLATAADQAEAGGAKQALLMIDGRGLVLDVAARAIVAEMKPDQTGGMLRVDAAMVVASDNPGAMRGSPFAGLNALTPARVASAMSPPAYRAIAPEPR